MAVNHTREINIASDKAFSLLKFLFTVHIIITFFCVFVGKKYTLRSKRLKVSSDRTGEAYYENVQEI